MVPLLGKGNRQITGPHWPAGLPCLAREKMVAGELQPRLFSGVHAQTHVCTYTYKITQPCISFSFLDTMPAKGWKV